MEEPQLLQDPDTDETYVVCPHCERMTPILEMLETLGCQCEELIVFQDGQSIIMVPVDGIPEA